MSANLSMLPLLVSDKSKWNDVEHRQSIISWATSGTFFLQFIVPFIPVTNTLYPTQAEEQQERQ